MNLWEASDRAGQVELRFNPRRERGFVLTLVLVSLFAAGSLYGALSVIGWWIRDGEILPGAVVLLLLATGGVVLSWHFVTLLFRMVTAVLSATHLSIIDRRIGKTSEVSIPKTAIHSLVEIYAPPPQDASPSNPGSWTVCVRYHSEAGQTRDYCFDGDNERDAQVLLVHLSPWLGIEATKENAAD